MITPFLKMSNKENHCTAKQCLFFHSMTFLHSLYSFLQPWSKPQNRKRMCEAVERKNERIWVSTSPGCICSKQAHCIHFTQQLYHIFFTSLWNTPLGSLWAHNIFPFQQTVWRAKPLNKLTLFLRIPDWWHSGFCVVLGCCSTLSNSSSTSCDLLDGPHQWHQSHTWDLQTQSHQSHTYDRQTVFAHFNVSTLYLCSVLTLLKKKESRTV